MSNVVLIGYMGVGKSTIGIEIAKIFSKDFIDTDALIEEKESKSISEIFNLFGERHFRKLEERLLIHSQFHNHVISTGGGMPCFDNNVMRLKEIGTTIYLKISPENLADRLWVGRKKRPLISQIETVEDLVDFIRTKLEEREEYYLQADFVIDVNGKASCEVVDEIGTVVKKIN